MTRRSKTISKYEKSSKLINIVKKCKIMDLNDEAIINTIEFETGKKIVPERLGELVELAKREVREQQIEVDVHMDHMVKIGLYTDAMNQHEQLTTIEKVIYSMILKEEVKPEKQKNVNLILAMAATLTKIYATKNNTITNIGFLSKTKAIWKQSMEQQQQDSQQQNPLKINSATIQEPKAAIMIKDQKQDVEKLIDQVIDAKELENNRVA